MNNDIELNRIYHKDCLVGLKDIPDGSIDAIVADPPYFLGMTHNGQKGSFSDLNIAVPFFVQLFEEYERVLSDEGSIYFFTDWRGYAFYYPLFDKIIGAKNMLVWEKLSGAGSFYVFSHELVIFHTRQRTIKGGTNVIKDIRSFASGAKRTNGEKVHPTQKPIELIEKFILNSTQKGDTVLDTFMGSGTTAVACLRTGRKFVGFEIDKEYHRIAMGRVDTEKRG